MQPCKICGVEVECLHRKGEFTPADVRNITDEFKQYGEDRKMILDFAKDIKAMGIRAAFEKWGIVL